MSQSVDLISFITKAESLAPCKGEGGWWVAFNEVAFGGVKPVDLGPWSNNDDDDNDDGNDNNDNDDDDDEYKVLTS